MSSSRFETATEQIRDVFGQSTVEHRVCALVLEHFRRLGTHFDALRLGDVASELKLHDRADCQAMVKALDFLSIGPNALLDKRFEYWPEYDDAVLQDPIPVSAETIRDALIEGVFYDPRNGTVVGNFEDLVTILYAPSDYSRRLLGEGA